MVTLKEVKFFSALFDFSFDTFVTTKIIRILYLILVAGAGLMALSIAAGGLAARNALVGIVTIVFFAPAAFLLAVIYARVLLELIMVIFKISRDVSALVETSSREE